MKKKTTQHHIDALAALLLFGVFAVCVLAVLLSGADAYQRLTRRDQRAFDRRTAAQYLATRVRQADAAGGVAVEEFGGVRSLVLDAQSSYPTWLYCYDGQLMELYCYFEERPGPEDGQPLLELKGLDPELTDGLLTLRLTQPGGETDTLLLSLRSWQWSHHGEGAAP